MVLGRGRDDPIDHGVVPLDGVFLVAVEGENLVPDGLKIPHGGFPRKMLFRAVVDLFGLQQFHLEIPF